MFVVYWMEGYSGDKRPQCRLLDQDSMAQALTFMEVLRTAQRNGERDFSFITMSSENPDAVGKTGAADPELAYGWTKRRGNRPRAKKDLVRGDFADY